MSNWEMVKIFYATVGWVFLLIVFPVIGILFVIGLVTH